MGMNSKNEEEEMEKQKKEEGEEEEEKVASVVIAGAGLVGLTLALALNKHCGINVELYEQAKAFNDGIGAGIGMYPNGLRVLRDISPSLVQQIREQGLPYLFRRWERHDGTEVAVSEENVLCEEDDLQPLGIRRWRLQKILFDAVQMEEGITVHFDKKIKSVSQSSLSSSTSSSTTTTTLELCDGTSRSTRLLLAADGAKSPIRNAVTGIGNSNRNSSTTCTTRTRTHTASALKYTGTTCLYGCANVPIKTRGICFPSAETTKCHGCFYPVSINEQCFQFHMPTELNNNDDNNDNDNNNKGGWGSSPMENVGRAECIKLASRLKKDGWDEKYLEPLYNATSAIKVPFALLEPHLKTFVYDRVVLVGDAAHPPVPYLGQGFQQGLEDAATLTLLLKHFCCSNSRSTNKDNNNDDNINNDHFCFDHIDAALKVYDGLRVSRTAGVIRRSKTMGLMQQKRANNKQYQRAKEELIRRDVFFHETIPLIYPGVTYNYKEEVDRALNNEPLLSVLEDHPSSSCVH